MYFSLQILKKNNVNFVCYVSMGKLAADSNVTESWQKWKMYQSNLSHRTPMYCPSYCSQAQQEHDAIVYCNEMTPQQEYGILLFLFYAGNDGSIFSLGGILYD